MSTTWRRDVYVEVPGYSPKYHDVGFVLRLIYVKTQNTIYIIYYMYVYIYMLMIWVWFIDWLMDWLIDCGTFKRDIL